MSAPAPNNSTEATQGQPATTAEILQTFQLMPRIRDILTAIENSEDPDGVKRAVDKFQRQIQSCKEFLDTLPGIDQTEEERLRVKEQLERTVAMKMALMKRYKLEIPRLD